MKNILDSKFTSILLGLILISYGIFDIYEELFQPAHEHILIIIGFFMVINAFGHAQEGVHKIAHAVASGKKMNVLERIGRLYNHSIMRILMGVTVLITSFYGLYEDIEKIHSKSVSIGVGIIIMTLPIISSIMGTKNLSKGIRRDSSD